MMLKWLIRRHVGPVGHRFGYNAARLRDSLEANGPGHGRAHGRVTVAGMPVAIARRVA
jgi:hypothetical protein